MTYTLNGVGTRICGERLLTKEEIDAWSKNFPFLPGQSPSNFFIGTESLVFGFPILPLKTYIYCYTKKGFFTRSAYQIVYYPPSGKPEIYWPHVKSSLIFYVFPVLLIIIGISFFIPFFHKQ